MQQKKTALQSLLQSPGVISDGCQVNVVRERVEIYPDEDDPTTIWEFAEALTGEVNFYGDYIHYTANDVNYRVFLKIGNDFIEMADIDEAVSALKNN